ncbi:BatD family protein [Saccharospirillum impatiens]|uniref:BatD family protein n=1 Tax=Saccharospirillum impatiens TaxID=169438 RepID=UPI0003FDD354|nr:BatD family protein [Saccharospirillum impatiens]
MVNTARARLRSLLARLPLRVGGCLATLCLLSAAASATVTADADRTRLYQDETLTLTIRANFPAANEPLDLTALTTLFQVVGQSQTTQSRYSTAQGQERWREWRLQIQPREIGTLAIPNFSLGGEQSSPIMVTVMNPADRQEGLPEEAVILSVSIDDDSLYIGQSTTLTVNLDYQVRLQGNFDQLDLSAFDAEKLNEDNTQTRHGGQPYRRYQLVYRLTPEQDGTLSIPEIRFVGQYESSNYGQQLRMHRIHPGFDVAVKPIPASYPANAVWLPAESVSLSDNLGSRIQAEVNEHIDWQVSTRIQGQPATQLPDPLASLADDDFRLYRNSPEFTQTGGLQQRTDQAALVFSSPGNYDLPAVRVPWWDIKNDRLRYAELSARSIRIEGISNEAMDILANPSRSDSEPGTVDAANQRSATATLAGQGGVWRWVSVSLGIGWLATALVFWASNRYLKRRLRETVSRSVPESTEPRPAEDDMARAAHSGDVSAYHAALLRWLRARRGWTPAQLRAKLGESERGILAQAESYLFAGTADTQAPDRKALITLNDAVQALQASRAPGTEPDVMTLYP